MKLVISSDHAGFPLKQDVRANLIAAGHEVVGLGAYKVEPKDDHPDFAEKVGDAIKAGVAPRGLLICGSGVGVCVAANKIPGFVPGFATTVCANSNRICISISTLKTIFCSREPSSWRRLYPIDKGALPTERDRAISCEGVKG